MGAWGIGIFQDDTALDYVDDLRNEDRPLDRMRAAFEDAVRAEYLEYDGAQAALVSAAVVDAVAGSSSLLDDDDDLRSWIGELDANEARSLRAMAAKACARVLAAGSELDELWSENADDYPRWRAQVSQLASRLSS